MADHNDLGKHGELLALKYLRKQGYTILDVNWHWKKLELDIVALDKEYLVFL